MRGNAGRGKKAEGSRTSRRFNLPENEGQLIAAAAKFARLEDYVRRTLAKRVFEEKFREVLSQS